MNRERLTILAEFLEKGEFPGRFDMSVWADQWTNDQPMCGTSACAAGWAATIPAFREAGYHLSEYGSPAYKTSRSYAALQYFFGLTPWDVRHIFSPGYYPAKETPILPVTVARRIRELLELGT